jgi:sulfoxide reductase heme-binding subunit YedZ
MKTSKIQVGTNTIALLSGIALLIQVSLGTLSANPIHTATVLTGHIAIYLLLASLFCSPINNLLKMSMFLWIRKTFGLYAFYYALIHFLIFSVFDYQLNLQWIIPEIVQKPFLQIGFAALFLLLLLALTSIQIFKKMLGKWWKRIHNLVYLIIILIIIHITLASKGDLIEPIILGGLFLFAMLWRIPPLKNISIQNMPKWSRDLNTFLIQ